MINSDHKNKCRKAKIKKTTFFKKFFYWNENIIVEVQLNKKKKINGSSLKLFLVIKFKLKKNGLMKTIEPILCVPENNFIVHLLLISGFPRLYKFQSKF